MIELVLAQLVRDIAEFDLNIGCPLGMWKSIEHGDLDRLVFVILDNQSVREAQLSIAALDTFASIGEFSLGSKLGISTESNDERLASSNGRNLATSDKATV